MVIRYLDELKATPSCHFVNNKVVFNFIAHTQASIIIMNINILRFGIFFALIGIIFCVFIPDTESSPFPRNVGEGESRGGGSIYGLRSSFRESSYNRIQQRTKRDNVNPHTNDPNNGPCDPEEITPTWAIVLLVISCFGFFCIALVVIFKYVPGCICC